MKNKVLVNCSGLHVGGGVAVATSIISELAKTPDLNCQYDILASTEVYSNLISMNINIESFNKIIIFNTHGLDSLYKIYPVRMVNYDCIFTVFGPAYFLKRYRNLIVGFADPYIANKSVQSVYSFLYKRNILFKLKFFLKKFFFSRASHLIVELPSIKTALVNELGFKEPYIHVINSAIDSVFFDPMRWKGISFPKNIPNHFLKLGVISRNYPHKNLTVLLAVKERLLEKYGVSVAIFLTLTDKEWYSFSENFRCEIINIGPLNLDQCPDFYSQLDAVIFPTLLECFSAVPLEAMIMRKPLFASDFPFIRDVCGLNCNYFNPLSVDSIVDVIYKFLLLPPNSRHDFIEASYKFALNYPSSEARAKSYVTLIDSLLTTSFKCK